MRNHSVQYVSEPEFGWYRLRRAWPWVYESHAELALETWTKVRIEVAGRAAKLYLNGSSKPSLIVDGLKGQDLRGGVGLWSFTDEEAYFSNVRIMPEEPLSVKNGSDAAGFWEMRYSSDAGGMDASMELHRDGSKVTGTWSGPLGENRAITGTCQGHAQTRFCFRSAFDQEGVELGKEFTLDRPKGYEEYGDQFDAYETEREKARI